MTERIPDSHPTAHEGPLINVQWKIMGTSRQKTERALQLAKDAVSGRVKALEAKGTKAEAFGDDPQWRELDGKVRQLGARLRKIAEVEAVEVDLAKNKEERAARLAELKAEKKAGKKKEAKAEEKPKKKEGGAKEKAPAKAKK